MTDLLQRLRNIVKGVLSRHELVLISFWKGILCLFSLFAIKFGFNNSTFVDNYLFILIVSIAGMFVPLSATALIIVFTTVVHIANFSPQAAFAVCIMFMLFYFISIYYKSPNRWSIVFSMVFYQMKIPFCVPMVAGLVGNINDVVSITAGAGIGYYLKLIMENKAVLTNGTSDIDAFSLIFKQMLMSPNFYCFIASQIAMFLIVNNLRSKKIKHSGIIGVSLGSFVSIVIMITGNLIFDSSEKAYVLMIEAIVTWIIGVIITYFFVETDYVSPESFQMEDDEYYYYVTAIPKVHFTKEERKIKKVTDNKKKEEM